MNKNGLRYGDIKDGSEDAFVDALCADCKRRIAKVMDEAARRNSEHFDFAACPPCHRRIAGLLVLGDLVVEAQS